MDHDSTEAFPPRLERVVEQADKMVAAGRLTAEEAEFLRAAPGPAGAEKVLREIRARHAGERLDVAVAEGAMTRHEADGILDAVRGGEHSRQLRSHLIQFRPQRRSKDPSSPPSSNLGAGEDRPA
jgi:polyhydroxyalkanoate synthesis regulator phasin